MGTPMVISTKKDIKTQTRRLRGLEYVNQLPDVWQPYSDPGIMGNGKYGQLFQHKGSGNIVMCACPYGHPGDVLWVRESWSTCYNAATIEFDYKYKADHGLYIDDVRPVKWKPSIHMPRKAARIFLRITDIRVERLQDITDKDARAEGVEFQGFDQTIGSKNYLDGSWFVSWGTLPEFIPINQLARRSFETLWQSINGTDSWAANPWVWVISFKRIESPD